MKIEAVTVCVDYSHYLKKVISNKNKLDRWVIVTHRSDKDTIKLCKKENIEFVLSKKIFKKAKFAKGKAINEGLNILEKKDWILHLDADQLLPENFREITKQTCTDETKLYGCRRFKTTEEPMPGLKLVKKCPVSGINKVYILHLPIGFFQLWHSSICTKYPSVSKNTLHDDWIFLSNWRKHGDKWIDFKKRFEILDLKLIDVCGCWGSKSGHINGIRNLKQK
jgi:hypothetical protein